MEIRKATTNDIPAIRDIFKVAKQIMIDEGDIHQWEEEDYPECKLDNDITNNEGYVILEDNKIHAYFYLHDGEDPTYKKIYYGHWLNHNPYVVIHRIASDGELHDVFGLILYFALSKGKDVRIDTHPDNVIMKHLLDKYGFKKCGLIHIPNIGDRIAYQKIN